MRLPGKALLCLLSCAFATAGAGTADSQTVTTGTLSGTVIDQQGGVLPGASVTAVHVPTGATYEGVTQGDGRYAFVGVRVGGPYSMKVSLQGFRERTKSDLTVKLGEEAVVDFTLELATVTESVTVTGETPLIDSTRAGTASNVTNEALDALPTVSRDLFDFARVSPHFTPIALNTDPNSISIAGQNNRYNNVQIDGAVNNDLFGLAASGTPGGQTEAQPISLDAIQELQLLVSPYDVRQGMFAGGGINAITKSGTNRIKASGYYYGRNQTLVGDSPSGTPIADFSSKQFGGSAGGPIVRNKAFYFGNVDSGRRDTPSGFSINSTGQQWGLDAEAQRFLGILQNRYGYNPGGPGEFIRVTNNDKVFVRSDLNLGKHQLTGRHNYIKAQNDIGRPDNTRFIFPDNFYQFRSRSNSTVGQVNSTFGRAFNELRVTYQRVRDRRTGQPDEPKAFPQVDVRVGPGGSRFLRAGRESFSTANELDQDILELTDDYTMVRGNHTFLLGTHNEFFKFRNLFIRDAFGTYTFQSLDLFEQGLAQAYDYSFSVTSDPRQPARFKVSQFGVYAGDQWHAGDRLTVSFGVRLDLPRFPDKPTRNPDTEALFGLRTDIVPNQQLWSPRVGFNYNLGARRRGQVRGGVGLFSGRTPYVWLSNQYTSTGIEFTRLRIAERSTVRQLFVADVNAQPRSVTGVGASRNEIDLVDPDYTFPQLVRGNLAYDRELGFTGLVGTAELLFSKTIKDIKYQNLNIRQTDTRPDGRPVHSFTATQYGDVIFLTNTDQGHQWSVSFKAEKPWRRGWFASGSYLHGRARSIMDGTSSQAASNWGNVYNPGDPNNTPLTRSNFDVGHRLNLVLSRDIPLGRGSRATASVYYSTQSGRPYSLNYSSDFNGDARTTNDLLYIPRSAGEVEFRNGTFDQFMAFINSETCYSDFIGSIHERNACRAPRIHTMDFKFAVALPARRARVDLTFDVLNVMNAFGNDSGLLKYANFNDILVARFAGLNAAGRPIYDIGSLLAPTFTKFIRDDLKSRWQGQFGLRLRF